MGEADSVPGIVERLNDGGPVEIEELFARFAGGLTQVAEAHLIRHGPGQPHQDGRRSEALSDFQVGVPIDDSPYKAVAGPSGPTEPRQRVWPPDAPDDEFTSTPESFLARLHSGPGIVVRGVNDE
jgi:hypothetical protein